MGVHTRHTMVVVEQKMMTGVLRNAYLVETRTCRKWVYVLYIQTTEYVLPPLATPISFIDFTLWLNQRFLNCISLLKKRFINIKTFIIERVIIDLAFSLGILAYGGKSGYFLELHCAH